MKAENPKQAQFVGVSSVVTSWLPGAIASFSTICAESTDPKGAIQSACDTVRQLARRCKDLQSLPLITVVNDTTPLALIRAFVEEKANINGVDNNGRTLLHDLVARKLDFDDTWRYLDKEPTERWRLVELLLQKGADVNAVDNEGNTPLHILARTHQCESTAELLFAYGANANAVDRLERTPMHLLLIGTGPSDESTLHCMCTHGADVNARDVAGRTPLHTVVDSEYATFPGTARLLMLLSTLCDYGADVNAADDSGLTALHIAAARCKYSAVTLLLERGANVDAVDGNDMRPVHMLLGTITPSSRYSRSFIRKGLSVITFLSIEWRFFLNANSVQHFSHVFLSRCIDIVL